MRLDDLRKRQKELETNLREVREQIALEEEKEVLWRVTFSGDLFVLANDAGNACSTALYHAQDDDSVKAKARLVTKLSEVPKGWRNAIPWQGTSEYDERLGDLKIKDYFARKGAR
jgi:hypothetical protein